MKFLLLLGFVWLSGPFAQAGQIFLSSTDPAYAEAREAAFIPWSSPRESVGYWEKLSSSHVPIYYQRKPGFSRDIYIPNPGIAYCVLACLNEERLFKVHQEKLKIGDTLISASVYQPPAGEKIYWALWAPKDRAYLLTDQLKKFGITQARIEL